MTLKKYIGVRKGEERRGNETDERSSFFFGFPFGFITFPDGKHGPAIEDCVSQLSLSHTHKHTTGPQHRDSSLVTWSHTC